MRRFFMAYELFNIEMGIRKKFNFKNIKTNKVEEFKTELQKITESEIIPISSHTKFGINKLRLSLVKICE